MKNFYVDRFVYPCQAKQKIDQLTTSILLRRRKVDQLKLKMKKFEKEIRELEEQQDILIDKMEEMIPLKYQKRFQVS